MLKSFFVQLALITLAPHLTWGTPKFPIESLYWQLPAKVADFLKNHVEVRFSDLGPFPNYLGCEKESQVPHGVAGKSSTFFGKNRIVINSRLLNANLKVCKFSSTQNYIKSVIVHELAHLLDARGIANLPQCNEFQIENKICPAEGMMKISDSFRFRQIAPQNPVSFFRSPDLYEATNPQEYFAVNFEYFILDSNYKCRRPFMFRFFKETFNFDPYSEALCTPELTGFFIRTGKVFKIDPSRIRKISYLHAGPGSALSARWGHSMLDVLTCELHEPTESCDAKKRNHLIVSYRALLTQRDIDPWESIIGKNFSTVFFYTLQEIEKEYSEKELRDLYFYPLQLSASQSKAIVEKVFEGYWERFQHYYLLSNNCAHETLRVIQSALPQNHRLQGDFLTTPQGLIHVFERNSFFSGPAVHVKSSELQKRFHARKFIQKHTGLDLDFHDYFKLTEQQRLELLTNSTASDHQRAQLAGYLYVYEWHSFYLKSSQIFVQAQDDLRLNSEWKAMLEEGVKATQQPIGVWTVAKSMSGYGIPLLHEIENPNYLENQRNRQEELKTILYAKMNLDYKPVSFELSKLRKLMDYFKQESLK